MTNQSEIFVLYYCQRTTPGVGVWRAAENRKCSRKRISRKKRDTFMVKMTLSVDGMACGMCEAHVNDAVRKVFQVKKVTSSHSKGTTEIIAEEPLDEEKLKNAIEATGYSVLDVKTEPYEKKKFSLFHRG
mgnify:CR=1 FL=1